MQATMSRETGTLVLQLPDNELLQQSQSQRNNPSPMQVQTAKLLSDDHAPHSYKPNSEAVISTCMHRGQDIESCLDLRHSIPQALTEGMRICGWLSQK